MNSGAVVVWIWWTALAVAEETTDETIVVEAEAPQTTASTTIVIDEEFASTATLSEALQLYSGIQIRNLGGLGTMSTISIRGTSTRQNLLLLNGIPLNPDGVSTVNLQDIPLHMLEQIDLYRSHSPLRLMSSSMGGVIDMTSTEETASLHGGIDSWTNRWFRGTVPLQRKSGSGTVFVSGLRAINGFSYFDNQNTPFNAEDDVWNVRVNNDVTQGNLLTTWSTDKVDVLHTGLWREQGIPGHLIIPTPRIRLTSQRHLTGLHSTLDSDNILHDLQGWHSYQNEILDDSFGNLGQGELVIDWRYHMLGAKGFHQLWNSETWFPSIGWMLRLDQATDAGVGDRNQRFGGQIQLGQEMVRDQWEWTTGVTTHWLSSQPSSVVVAPKTSVLWHISDVHHGWISLIRGFRPPDFTEIYGHRGAIIGNPDLLPETGVTLDVGWTRQEADHWLPYTQISLFGRASQNEIIFVQNAQRESIPLNFEETRVLGVESDWSLMLGEHCSLDGSVSFTHSENRSNIASVQGKDLPNVPRWMVGQQFWWMTDRVWLGSNVYWSAGNYWDASNQRRAPDRFLQDATFRWVSDSLQAELTGRNLWNRIVVDTPVDPLNPQLGMHQDAVQDFLGYPLMGRSVSISLTWTPLEERL